MPDANPPIKRSAELAPLSREHHKGLLFVWKIKQGLQKDIDTKRISAFVHWFWTVELAPHFQKEETLLLPALGKKMSLKERLLDEHAAIRKLMEDLQNHSTVELLQKLANAVHDHIRFEERVLFKHIEVSASAEELMEIGKALAVVKKKLPVWEDEFWVK